MSGGVWFPDCARLRLYERGSVLVITMSFHSRGILDVVAPVQRDGAGSASPMREVNK